jgi:hypothetical protein
MSIVAWRTIVLIEMVNRANQAGIVAVTDGIEIVGNAKPGQMLAQQRQKSRAFHNAAADKNGLRIEDINEVIKAMAQAIEELGDQTLANRVAGVIAVKIIRLSRSPAAQRYVPHSDGAALCRVQFSFIE